MAFITVATGGNTEGGNDRLPVLSYNAKAGRLFTLDRVNENDTWRTDKVDVTMRQPAFAVDLLGSLEVGWAYYPAAAAPMFVVVPYGQPLPPKPPSPGNDEKGKALQFKSAFRVTVIGKDIGGMREFGGTANALLGAMNELHTAWEAAGGPTSGQIPLVKMTNVIEVKSGQGSNFAPVFEIISYVDRPAMLPAVGAKPAAAPAPAPVHTPAPANHVPPPAPRAAAPANAMPF